MQHDRTAITDEPKFIRAMHPAAFRSGEWAQVVARRMAPGGLACGGPRPCWLVVFPDGATDSWVCDDPMAKYEFADQAPS